MDNKDINIEKENNTTKLKKIKIFIILIILIIVFLLYGIITNNTAAVSLEEQILSYLKEKYPESDFEIEQLVDSTQARTSGLGCDGSYIIEPKNIKGDYYYYYDMLSKLDDIKFNISLEDDNGKVEIKDSYDTCKKMIECVKKIQDYIILEIGDENSKKSSYYTDYKTFPSYSLSYSCNIDVYIDKNFRDILSEDFINKLHLINTYENNITNDYDNVYFSIYVHDNIGNYIAVSSFASLEGFYVYNEENKCLGEINEYYSGKQIINIK